MIGKRGQFYIIAALVIVFLIIGFFSLKNYAKKDRESEKIYDFGKELNIESGNVINYGVYNKQDTDILIQNWSQVYYDYSSSQSTIENWILIYGDTKEATALTFSTEDSGEIFLISGGIKITIPLRKTIKGNNTITPEGNVVNILFKNNTYSFNLEGEENFFFVLNSGGSTVSG